MEILVAFLVGIGVFTDGYKDLKLEDKSEPVFIVMMQDKPCNLNDGSVRVADLSIPVERRTYMSNSGGVCTDEK